MGEKIKFNTRELHSVHLLLNCLVNVFNKKAYRFFQQADECINITEDFKSVMEPPRSGYLNIENLEPNTMYKVMSRSNVISKLQGHKVILEVQGHKIVTSYKF